MSSKPLISIVTVCMNSAGHLERCIKSVASQTYTNIEYIIIDGGSTDGTLDIIRTYEDKISRWICEKDKGIYDAMNKGIAMCSGDYIGLLNSDDYYTPDAVQVIADAVVEDESIEVIHGNVVLTYDSGYVVQVGNHDDLLRQWTVHHNACFITQEIYKSNKYDIVTKVSADYKLILKLFYEGKKFKHVDRLILYFSPYGASAKSSLANRCDKFSIRAKYSIVIAAILFVKETFIHYDEKLHDYTSSMSNKADNGPAFNVFILAKKIIKPLYLKIKKIIIRY